MATMFDPAHSGSILKETLSYLKIRPRIFARKINISPDTLEQILRGKSPITFEVAQCIDSSWSLYQYLGSNAVKF